MVGQASIFVPVIGALANVLAVEVLQLGEIEARRRPADRVQIEPFDRLRGRDDFGIAAGPAQPQQIVT